MNNNSAPKNQAIPKKELHTLNQHLGKVLPNPQNEFLPSENQNAAKLSFSKRNLKFSLTTETE